jgi:WD40 repeat-containing protein SMU1
MTSEIDSKDVVRLMLQYMKENNLTTSLRALQTETGVCMNTVDSLEVFVRNIQQGRWDTVLAQVSTLQLPQDKLISVGIICMCLCMQAEHFFSLFLYHVVCFLYVMLSVS